jgi:hypothetical protein
LAPSIVDNETRDARDAKSVGTPLDLRDLLETGGAALRPSPKALALAGNRVRLQGFMAEMEILPKGAFYLVAHPVHCDEAGGGTADLPPETVLVVVPSLASKAMAYVRGALALNGIFEVGNRTDEEGRVSGFRLILDGPLLPLQKETAP